jgi:hypothetical protein
MQRWLKVYARPEHDKVYHGPREASNTHIANAAAIANAV